MFIAAPCLMFATVVVIFPKMFPWLTHFQTAPDESQFVRYSPLGQGASEILDEQANWLQVKEPFMRSVWEEGGLSPEEFEKTFEVRPSLTPKSGNGEEK